MVEFAQALSALGLDVVTFNFLYTEQKRRIPDRAPVLEDCYRAVIDAVRARLDSATRALFIGGKSMGGRIATQVAAADPQLPIAGLVLLGYPLHPPGQPHKLRDAHLPLVGRPMLFVQGSRDAFGTRRAGADPRQANAVADRSHDRRRRSLIQGEQEGSGTTSGDPCGDSADDRRLDYSWREVITKS